VNNQSQMLAKVDLTDAGARILVYRVMLTVFHYYDFLVQRGMVLMMVRDH
jgi:hypothetical protein